MIAVDRAALAAALDDGLGEQIEPELAAVLAAFAEQDKHGHTAESDAELPLDHFATRLVQRSQEAADVMRGGPQQNLPVAYRRLARDAGVAIAAMRRIRLDPTQGEQRS